MKSTYSSVTSHDVAIRGIMFASSSSHPRVSYADILNFWLPQPGIHPCGSPTGTPTVFIAIESVPLGPLDGAGASTSFFGS